MGLVLFYFVKRKAHESANIMLRVALCHSSLRQVGIDPPPPHPQGHMTHPLPERDLPFFAYSHEYLKYIYIMSSCFHF